MKQRKIGEKSQSEPKDKALEIIDELNNDIDDLLENFPNDSINKRNIMRIQWKVIKIKQTVKRIRTISLRKKIRPGNLGFSAPRKISDKFVNFMGLNNLEEGNIVTYSFATKYFASYFKLVCDEHKDGYSYINLTPPLKELFHDAMIDKNIDPEKFRFFDLPKVLSFNFEGGVYKKYDVVQGKNIISRPEHLDDLNDFLTEIMNYFREHRQKMLKLQKDFDGEESLEKIEILKASHKERVEDIMLKWIVTGLASIVMDIEKKVLKVYGGDDDSDCCICMEVNKDSVFSPCGHYSCCNKCATIMCYKKLPCPICRKMILKVVLFKDLEKERSEIERGEIEI